MGNRFIHSHLTMRELFWLNVDIYYDITDEDCWNWIGPKRTGYGSLYKDNIKMYAHIYSYSTFKGPVGDLLVCHKCDNKRCVNPNHLFLGTHKDNTLDCWHKNLHGVDRKIQQSDVSKIKKLYLEDGLTQKEISVMFNVHQSEISKTIAGKRNSHA